MRRADYRRHLAQTAGDDPAGEFRQDLYCRLAVLTFEVAPLRERREDIPALVDQYLREAACAVAAHSDHSASYLIEQGAVELLCGFDYPGNIRVLRNLMYELISYAGDGEPITIEMVAEALGRIRERELLTPPAGTTVQAAAPSVRPTSVEPANGRQEFGGDALALHNPLRSMADESDIILPLEICLLRRGETFREWAARAKRCSIEATRHAAGGTMLGAAERLGVTSSSLKGLLHRAKTAHSAASI